MRYTIQWGDSLVLPRSRQTMLKPCMLYTSYFYLASSSQPIQLPSHRFPVCQRTGKQNLQPGKSKQHRQQRSLREKGGCIYKLELLSHSLLPRDPFQKKESRLPNGVFTHPAVPGRGKAAPTHPLASPAHTAKQASPADCHQHQHRLPYCSPTHSQPSPRAPTSQDFLTSLRKSNI